MISSNSRKCPKCGKKMNYIRGANTFDGSVPESYVCECGYEKDFEKIILNI